MTKLTQHRLHLIEDLATEERKQRLRKAQFNWPGFLAFAGSILFWAIIVGLTLAGWLRHH
jgi:hypothetical protein